MKESGYLSTLSELLSIDSTTGHYEEIQDYVLAFCKKHRFPVTTLRKGGVIAEVGGKGNPLVITVHMDDIGLMVRHINPDGTLKVCPVGGLHEEYALLANVRVHTREGKVISGTVQRDSASVHVTPDDVLAQKPDYGKNVVVVLDEEVREKKDAEELGISVGDSIALDANFTVENGYLKSRFLDDKALAAIVMEWMKDVDRKKLKRKVSVYFAMYEEIGHGTSFLPEGTEDILALDIACVGPEQTSDEHKVTIFAKDSRFPYHEGFTTEFVRLAKKEGIDHAVDIFTPHYGTDADTTLVAGHDVRHAAIGPGTRATHGYERIHMDGIRATYDLLAAYLRS